MAQERLSGLATLSIENKPACSLDLKGWYGILPNSTLKDVRMCTRPQACNKTDTVVLLLR